MLTLLRKLRTRLGDIERAINRIEMIQMDNQRVTQTLLQDLSALRQAQADARDEANQGISYLRGTAENTRQLSGDTLAALNDYRMNDGATADLARLSLGRIESRQISSPTGEPREWNDAEFRVYSQFGEDGLIQFLFQHLPAAPRTFIEFGVEDYSEANTRFLLTKDRSWSGLVMDGSEENVTAIRRDPAYLRYNLKATAAWISRENINDLLRDQGFTGEIGLLSVDIDGNDFWVWKAIEAVNPVVVIAEYNYRFGPEHSVVVPYDPQFNKETAHPSGIYYGASLSALARLADHKGYSLVGCSGGVNAFFVRRDCLPPEISERTAAEAFVAGHHGEMRDAATGAARKAPLEEQMQLLLSLPLEVIDQESFSG